MGRHEHHLWARPPSLIASARHDWMYRHGARRNMVEDLALAAQGKQGVNIEAPDRRKLVADCSDLAATDRVMERRVAARKRVLKRGIIELRESALPCKVIDLSDTGAGLTLSGANQIPIFFILVIPDRAPVSAKASGAGKSEWA